MGSVTPIRNLTQIKERAENAEARAYTWIEQQIPLLDFRDRREPMDILDAAGRLEVCGACSEVGQVGAHRNYDGVFFECDEPGGCSRCSSITTCKECEGRGRVLAGAQS